MRVGKISRQTKETSVKIELNLDGSGKADVETLSTSLRGKMRFFDHLISSFAKHGCFDLKVRARGDLEHHVAEDVAIALGAALERALGKKAGIRRIGDAIVPMDETLVLVAVDLSGRAYADVKVKFVKREIEGLSTDLIAHVLETLAVNGKLNLHVQMLRGRNDHHKAEAIFKALGVALAEAVRKEPRRRGIPSTKGVI